MCGGCFELPFLFPTFASFVYYSIGTFSLFMYNCVQISYQGMQDAPVGKKVLATNPDDLNLMFVSQMVARKKLRSVTRTCTHINTHRIGR